MADPAVLLVHGFATSAARTWGENGWIDLLRDVGREVLAVDLLGHGEADKPHDPAAYARLEADVVDRLPDAPVDAIGFSLGARTILTIAAPQPHARAGTAGRPSRERAADRRAPKADASYGRKSAASAEGEASSGGAEAAAAAAARRRRVTRSHSRSTTTRTTRNITASHAT